MNWKPTAADLRECAYAFLVILFCLGIGGNDDFEEAVRHDSYCAQNPKSIACRSK
jgi:hypothetical protein